MFVVSAAGEWFPQMVVYKAQNVYASWCSRGTKGAIFSCPKSGWFDAFQFEKWFFEIMLPKLKRRTAKSCCLVTTWLLTYHLLLARHVCLPPAQFY
jgi:hypothetical protein